MQQANSSTPETLVTIPAWFDGDQIRLEGHYPLLLGARLLVTVLQPIAIQDDSTRREFAKLLARRGSSVDEDKYSTVLNEMEALRQAQKLKEP